MKLHNEILALLDILEDKTARIDEKDDALIDLGNCNNYLLLQKLVQFASNTENHPILLASAGESISQILARNQEFKIDLSQLAPQAKAEIQFSS